MTVYYIDLQGVGTKEQFHERLRGALPLPSYYGNNLVGSMLDALTLF